MPAWLILSLLGAEETAELLGLTALALIYFYATRKRGKT